MTLATGWTGWRRTAAQGNVIAAVMAVVVGVLFVPSTAAPAGADTITSVRTVPEASLLFDVACPTSTGCTAVGMKGRPPSSQGLVVSIANGVPGGTDAEPGISELRGVSPDGSMAVGIACTGLDEFGFPESCTGAVVPIVSGSLGSPQLVQGTVNLLDVACPTAGTCVAVGEGGVVVPIINGVAGAPQAVQGTSVLFGVACLSASSCVAVGGSSGQGAGGQVVGVLVPITNGVAAGAQLVPGTASLDGVACPSANVCRAVGDGGSVMSITNGTVGAVHAVPGASRLLDIACLSATRCEAVGRNVDVGVVVPIVDDTPRDALAVGGTEVLRGVACPSTTACVAVGGNSSAQGVVVSIAVETVVSTLTLGVSGSQTYGSSTPSFGIATRPPDGVTFTGNVTCTRVGTTLIEPTLPVGTWILDGSSCSGITLTGPRASEYQIAYQGGFFTVEQPAAAITITTTSLPDATGSQPYSQTLAATGGTQPYRWEPLDALPPDLSLSPEGVLSGTVSPFAFGQYSFRVRVSDASSPALTATAQLSLQVNKMGPPVISSISPSSGPAGTVVTIDGNLATASAIKFGGTPASDVFCTRTQCTATAPPGTGTVPVTVEGYWGTSTPAPNNYFTYVAAEPVAQAITFTSSAPAGPVVGGTYTATATGGASGNPVVFSAGTSSTPGACTVSPSGSVSFTGAGTCAINADQAGGPGYLAAPTVTQTLTITAPVRFPQSLPGVVTGSTSWSLGGSLATGPAVATFSYGTRPPALVPVAGDWDGDGTKTPGMFQGGVFKLRNTSSPGEPDVSFTFGDPRGFPVAGDFDGDGLDDVAVFRAGVWQLRYSDDGAATSFVFGSGSWPTVVPVAGDWDGDGTDGIGTYTYATGTWDLRQAAGAEAAAADRFVFWTGSGSYPVVGDWDADGDDTVGVKNGSRWSLNNANDDGAPDIVFDFGTANDLPVVWSR